MHRLQKKGVEDGVDPRRRLDDRVAPASKRLILAFSGGRR